MGVNISGGWKDATVVEFVSQNPLFSGMKFPLEVYKVIVEDTDSEGNKIGEHEEFCVTHSSLLTNYNVQLLPIGVIKNFSNVTPATYDGVIFKCTIEMNVSQVQIRELVQRGLMPPMENYKVHTESTGGATTGNCSSVIAKMHLAETAENRSFDRALIQFLALDMSEYGNRTLYGSSELDGKRVRIDEQNPANAAPKAPENRPAPAPAPIVKPDPVTPDKEELPSWCNSPKRTSAAPAPAAAPAAAPAPDDNASEKPVKVDEFADERAAAAKVTYTEEEYQQMLDHTLGGMVNNMSGKPIREVLALINKDNSAFRALQNYIIYKPYQSDLIPIWKCLVSYLVREKYLVIYPSKKFYLHKEPNGGK